MLAASLVVTAITVAAAGVATLGLEDLKVVVDDPRRVPSALDTVNSLAGACLVAVLAAWVATAWWLVDLRRVADWAAPDYRHRRSDWWALAAWVVPIVNLWFPYQLVADNSRALGSRARTFWPWWIAWLLISTGTGFVSSPRQSYGVKSALLFKILQALPAARSRPQIALASIRESAPIRTA